MAQITPNGNFSASVRARLAGIVAAVPSSVWTNEHISGAAEVAKVTGIQERRRVVGGQSTETLAIAAAQELLGQMRWERSSISVLIFVTQTPGRPIPASVYDIQRELRLPTHCMALHVNLSCSGYVAGLWMAMKMLSTGGRALLLVGDAMTPVIDQLDRATAPVFGDAVSATAIDWGHWTNRFVFGSSGMGNDALSQPAGGRLRMDGTEVLNFTLDRVPGLVDDVLAHHSTPDLLLFHQANRFMLDYLSKKSKLRERYPEAKVPTNLERFGNCSSASIPLLIADQCAQQVHSGCTAAMFGFGAGWAWAGAHIDLHDVEHVSLVEVS